MDDEFCAYCNYRLEDGYCAKCKQDAERPPTIDNGKLYSRSDTWVVVEPYEFTSSYAADAISESEIRDHIARSDIGSALLYADDRTTGSQAFDALVSGITNTLKRSKSIPKVSIQHTPWDDFDDRYISAVRIGPGVWFSGRKTVAASVTLVLNFLTGMLPAALLPMLLYGGLFWVFVSAYIRLDGLDKDVFETVYKLGLRRTRLVDEGAQDDEHWAEAYDYDPPATWEILDRFDKEDHDNVIVILTSLENRKVLNRSPEQTWTIAF